VILPVAIVVFIGVHFWRIRKDGGLYVPEAKNASPETVAPSIAKSVAEGAHD
jgi:hypothetical protein